MYARPCEDASNTSPFNFYLNPKVDSPPFTATVVAARLQHYQVDPVHQPWGLNNAVMNTII